MTSRDRPIEKKENKKLESRGWGVSATREFLDFTPEQKAYIELKLALGQKLKDF
jgi:hypothetical protein